MNILNRCVQDIVKYWHECKGMIALVAIVICIGAFGNRIHCWKKGVWSEIQIKTILLLQSDEAEFVICF